MAITEEEVEAAFDDLDRHPPTYEEMVGFLDGGDARMKALGLWNAKMAKASATVRAMLRKSHPLN